MTTLIGTVNIMADLKSNSCNSTFYTSVLLLGYYQINDDGGGEFYWDATSTEAENNATIIKVTSITVGRWKRVLNGNKLKVAWFGATGDNITDETPLIQNCLNYFPVSDDSYATLPMNAGIIDFPRDKTITITTSLKINSHQTINFNNCKLVYEGIMGGSCIERRSDEDEVVSKITLNDLLLEGGTNAGIGLNLYAISFSTVNNARILMSAENSIGINLVHGNHGNLQCYFNLIENVNIHMRNTNGTTGILINGTAASGANHNRIVGGLISGNDNIGIHIGSTNVNVGNFISNVDFEAISNDSNIAIKCDSPFNYFENNHIETYHRLIELNAGANIITGLTKAGTGTIVDNARGNFYKGITEDSESFVNVIGEASNDYGMGTRQVLSSVFSCNMIFKNTNTSEGSRNYALAAVGEGTEFSLIVSDAMNGNPMDAGTVIWKSTYAKNFQVEKNIGILEMPVYADNAAAVGDGLPVGYLYRVTGTGDVKIVI